MDFRSESIAAGQCKTLHDNGLGNPVRGWSSVAVDASRNFPRTPDAAARFAHNAALKSKTLKFGVYEQSIWGLRGKRVPMIIAKQSTIYADTYIRMSTKRSYC